MGAAGLRSRGRFTSRQDAGSPAGPEPNNDSGPEIPPGTADLDADTDQGRATGALLRHPDHCNA